MAGTPRGTAGRATDLREAPGSPHGDERPEEIEAVINEQYDPSRGRRVPAWRRWAPAGLLSIGLLTRLATSVHAATYHVSPSGNDGGSGSASSPWQSIGKGAQAAVAGD